jgi:hypothetical protein
MHQIDSIDFFVLAFQVRCDEVSGFCNVAGCIAKVLRDIAQANKQTSKQANKNKHKHKQTNKQTNKKTNKQTS